MMEKKEINEDLHGAFDEGDIVSSEDLYDGSLKDSEKALVLLKESEEMSNE